MTTSVSYGLWAVLLLVAMCHPSATQEARAWSVGWVNNSANTGCLHFTPNSSVQAGYIPASKITQTSAHLFCKLLGFTPNYYGVLYDNIYVCTQSTTYYNIAIDCPENATNFDTDCKFTDYGFIQTSAHASYLRCTPIDWEASSFSKNSHLRSLESTLAINVIPHTTNNGVGRITMTNRRTLTSMRPTTTIYDGSICMDDEGATSATGILGSNAAQATCRSLGWTSTSATMKNVTIAPSEPLYLSNFTCANDGIGKKLLDGACTYNTHVTDRPSEVCSGKRLYVPEVSCPVTLDLQLGTENSTTLQYRGFQTLLVNNTPICYRYSGASQNVGISMCSQFYTQFDFGALTSSSRGEEQIGYYLECNGLQGSSASCSAIVKVRTGDCESGYPTAIACKINQNNTYFFLENTDFGVGTLLTRNTATNSGWGKVCSDGFNQAAAEAACKTLQFTSSSGQGVTWQTLPATNTSNQSINNVTCAPNVSSLFDCSLQYSGTQTAASLSQSSRCSGYVYINCGFPTTSKKTTDSSSEGSSGSSGMSTWTILAIVGGSIGGIAIIYCFIRFVVLQKGCTDDDMTTSGNGNQELGPTRNTEGTQPTRTSPLARRPVDGPLLSVPEPQRVHPQQHQYHHQQHQQFQFTPNQQPPQHNPSAFNTPYPPHFIYYGQQQPVAGVPMDNGGQSPWIPQPPYQQRPYGVGTYTPIPPSHHRDDISGCSAAPTCGDHNPCKAD